MEAKVQKIKQFLADSTRHPATEDELEKVEKELKIRLPESYRAFQLEYGDFSHNDIYVFTVGIVEEGIVEVREHISQYGEDAFFQAFNGQIPPIPEKYIPFSFSGEDYYCFDIEKYADGECPVVYWSVLMDKDDVPDIVANTFVDWFVSEIDKIQSNT